MDAPGTKPTPASGLSQDEAALRLAAEGGNIMPASARHGLIAIAWDVAREPMFLLLVAAGVLYLLIGSPGDAAILLGFVVVVMGITIVQAQRSERALNALRDLAAPQAMVVRDGVSRRIPAAGLVRGDRLVLAEGDRVPADAVLREVRNLSVDESLLTGEAAAVAKSATALAMAMDAPGGDNMPCVFSGSLVTAGQGAAEVMATGWRTELGRIGAALARLAPERTQVQQDALRLVRILAIVGLGLCVLSAAAYAVTRGGDAAAWRQGLLAGITMAMATLPEELPMVLTIFFALGAWRIAHHRVLTRRMPAIEHLGAVTVLCTDKTGTLTMNRMAVASVLAGDGLLGLAEALRAPTPRLRELLETAILASRLDPFDPMERAILVAGESLSPGLASERRAWTLAREYALSPGLLAVAQAWRRDAAGPLHIAMKGAPEAVLGRCAMPADARADLERQAVAMACQGLRVLGVARGSLPADRLPELEQDLDLGFLGLIGLSDPLRADVPAAMAACRTAGIRVLMITGDYPATALSIARQAGLGDEPALITGAELQHMSDADLAARIGGVQVFARVVPAQKLRIVEALKLRGEVVAMTGDGVNDAPALKAAHIGIAMGGRGTDVARESAALVLLDDDFAAIVAAIRLGRRVFDNLRKAVSFTFAAHIPISGLCILPILVPSWPLLLLPVHIVFLELIVDPSCSLVFEAEAEEADIMTRPPRGRGDSLFAWRQVTPGLLQGAASLAACVGILLWAKAWRGEDAARTLTFVALVASFIAIIIVNHSRLQGLLGILRTPNRAQWWVVGGTSAILAAVLAVPAARALFRFAAPSPPDLLLAIAIGFLSVACLGFCRRRRALSAFTAPPHH